VGDAAHVTDDRSHVRFEDLYRTYYGAVMVGFLVVSFWVTLVVRQDLGGLESLVTRSPRGDGPGTLVLLLLKGLDLTSDEDYGGRR